MFSRMQVSGTSSDYFQFSIRLLLLLLLLCSLGTVVTGVLTYVGKTSDAQYTDTLMGARYYNALTTAGVLTLPLGMLVAYVVASRKVDAGRGSGTSGQKTGWP